MKHATIRITAALAFVAAGVLSILGDIERWWPACSRGNFDSAGCVTLQDYLYDSMVPQDPWVQTGNAAEFIGMGYLLLSIALIAAIPLAMKPHRVAAPLGLLAASACLVGASSLWAGLTNTPVPEPLGDYILLSYVVGGMLLVIWAWAAETLFTRWMSVRSHIFYLALLMTTLPLYGLASVALGYQSHDRTPWDGAVAGVLFMVAGVISLVAAKDRDDPTETLVRWNYPKTFSISEEAR